jgi:hypothetical protein
MQELDVKRAEGGGQKVCSKMNGKGTMGMRMGRVKDQRKEMCTLNKNNAGKGANVNGAGMNGSLE